MSQIVAVAVPIETPSEILVSLEPRVSKERFIRACAWVQNAFAYGEQSFPLEKPPRLDLSPLVAGQDEFSACFAEGAVFAAALYALNWAQTVRAVAANSSPENARFIFPRGPRWAEQLGLIGVALADAHKPSCASGGGKLVEFPATKLDVGRCWIVIEG